MHLIFTAIVLAGSGAAIIATLAARKSADLPRSAVAKVLDKVKFIPQSVVAEVDAVAKRWGARVEKAVQKVEAIPAVNNWFSFVGKTVTKVVDTVRDFSKPRGIRNNNPGNIRHGDNWQGLSADQTDEDFAEFDFPIYGIRAMAKVLKNYKRKYGIDTLYGVIARWAPAGDNNDVDAYVDQVTKKVGIGAQSKINLEQTETLFPLVQAIILHENGEQPFTDATIREGIELA